MTEPPVTDPHEFYEEHIEGREPSSECYQQFIELLWRAYGRKVHLFAYAWLKNDADARDVCQDAFLRMIEWIQTHRGETPPKVNFPAWLRRIARNLIISRFRRPALVRQWPREPADDGEGPGEFADWPDERTPDPLEAVTRAEQVEMLRTCIEMLPVKRREMIRMRWFRGMSYNDIAEETRMPVGTVGVQLHRAHQQIRECVALKAAD